MNSLEQSTYTKGFLFQINIKRLLKESITAYLVSTHTCYKVMINIFCVRGRTSIGLTTCQLIEKKLQVLKMMMKNVAS